MDQSWSHRSLGTIRIQHGSFSLLKTSNVFGCASLRLLATEAPPYSRTSSAIRISIARSAMIATSDRLGTYWVVRVYGGGTECVTMRKVESLMSQVEQGAIGMLLVL